MYVTEPDSKCKYSLERSKYSLDNSKPELFHLQFQRPELQSSVLLTYIKMSIRYLTVGILVSCICFASLRVEASDPDPVLDFEAGTTDFVLRDSYKNGEVFSSPGGLRVALNTTIFPALKGQGITSVQFKLNPCGVNPPHTHPRATELLSLISGGPIQAGFVDTAGEAHIYILYPGDILLFPRALLHYEVNVGTETAYFISALNSESPGTLTAIGGVLNLPTRAAAGALNQSPKVVSKLRKEIYAYGPSLQLDERSGCVPGKHITVEF